MTLTANREAQRRFLGAIKAGLSTPPKPLKDKPKVRKATKKTKKEVAST
jgi:hypothetical protein